MKNIVIVRLYIALTLVKYMSLNTYSCNLYKYGLGFFIMHIIVVLDYSGIL